jgi:hypothetical protein
LIEGERLTPSSRPTTHEADYDARQGAEQEGGRFRHGRDAEAVEECVMIAAVAGIRIEQAELRNCLPAGWRQQIARERRYVRTNPIGDLVDRERKRV